VRRSWPLLTTGSLNGTAAVKWDYGWYYSPTTDEADLDLVFFLQPVQSEYDTDDSLRKTMRNDSGLQHTNDTDLPLHYYLLDTSTSPLLVADDRRQAHKSAARLQPHHLRVPRRAGAFQW
jgi:hypothetical protein